MSESLQIITRQNYVNSDGTWTVPPGVTSIVVEVIGGGGAAWYYVTQKTGKPYMGSGGGGGGWARSKVLTVTPGQKFNIMVGAGGQNYQTATNDQLFGGKTWFNTAAYLYAEGGYPAHYSSPTLYSGSNRWVQPGGEGGLYGGQYAVAGKGGRGGAYDYQDSAFGPKDYVIRGASGGSAAGQSKAIYNGVYSGITGSGIGPADYTDNVKMPGAVSRFSYQGLGGEGGDGAHSRLEDQSDPNPVKGFGGGAGGWSSKLPINPSNGNGGHGAIIIRLFSTNPLLNQQFLGF